jgi:hypothetical protein
MENEEVFGVKTFQSASCPLGPGDRNDTGGGDVSKENCLTRSWEAAAILGSRVVGGEIKIRHYVTLRLRLKSS